MLYVLNTENNIGTQARYTKPQPTNTNVFDSNASQYQSRRFEQCSPMNEREKKRIYIRRTLEVENYSFTPVTFTVTGTMDIKCRNFILKFSELMAIKRDLIKSIMTSWMRTKISSALIRLTLMFLWFTFGQK